MVQAGFGTLPTNRNCCFPRMLQIAIRCPDGGREGLPPLPDGGRHFPTSGVGRKMQSGVRTPTTPSGRADPRARPRRRRPRPPAQTYRVAQHKRATTRSGAGGSAQPHCNYSADTEWSKGGPAPLPPLKLLFSANVDNRARRQNETQWSADHLNSSTRARGAARGDGSLRRAARVDGALEHEEEAPKEDEQAQAPQAAAQEPQQEAASVSFFAVTADIIADLSSTHTRLTRPRLY